MRNVTLADSIIVGNDYVGGIAGQHDNGALVNCRVEESVTIGAGCDPACYHGGIVGSRYGTIHGCFSAATVTRSGKSSCSYYGGIVGHKAGRTIQDCLALGCAVTADGPRGAVAGRIYMPDAMCDFYGYNGYTSVFNNRWRDSKHFTAEEC